MTSILNDMSYILPISMAVMPFYLVLRLLQIKKNSFYNTHTTIYRELGLIALIITMIFLFAITVGLDFVFYSTESIKEIRSSKPILINLIPFKTLSLMLKKMLSAFDMYSIINVVGNVIVFIPLGFFISLLSSKSKLLKAVLGTAIFSTIIEFLQMFVLRATDIDDVILNTLGGFLGYIFYIVLFKDANRFYKYTDSNIFKNRSKRQKTYITLIQLLVLIFFITSFVPVLRIYYKIMG